MTSELVSEAPITADRARALMDQARQGLAMTAEGLAMATEALSEAWRVRAWEALGYDTWDALCDAELGVRIAPRSDRQAIVRQLAQEGMSSRAIGPALGISDRQARYDMATGGQDFPPNPVTGLDGKLYPARTRMTPSQQPTPPMTRSAAESHLASLRASMDSMWDMLVAAMTEGMDDAQDVPGFADIAEHLWWMGRPTVARLRELASAATELADALESEQRADGEAP